MDTPATAVTTWHPGVILPREQLNPDLCVGIQLALSAAQTLALTCWAEARSRFVKGTGWVSNPIDAMADIVNVVDNRVRDPRWAKFGHKGTCLQRFQFSCWLPRAGADNDHDPQHLADNFEALMDRAQRLLAGETPTDKLLNCLALAEGAIGGAMVDGLGAATHYYAHEAIAPPAWSLPPAAMTAERWGHRFFKGVK